MLLSDWSPSGREKAQVPQIPQEHFPNITYPVFVVGHVTEHVIQVQDAAIAVLQSVDLEPVIRILQKDIKMRF